LGSELIFDLIVFLSEKAYDSKLFGEIVNAFVNCLSENEGVCLVRRVLNVAELCDTFEISTKFWIPFPQDYQYLVYPESRSGKEEGEDNKMTTRQGRIRVYPKGQNAMSSNAERRVTDIVHKLEISLNRPSNTSSLNTVQVDSNEALSCVFVQTQVPTSQLNK